MLIEAPISLGELIDKITILEIKVANISDANKLKNVSHELNVLNAKIDSLLDAESELIAGVSSKLVAAILTTQIRVATTAKLPNLKSYSLLLAGVGLLHRQQFSEFDRARQLFEALSERHPRHSS